VLPVPAMAGCFPRGVPQGDGPYFLPPHHDYADPLLDQPNDWGSEPEEDDGFVEVLEVDEYPCVDRPPFCRRGDDQRVYCMRMLPTIGDRACRRAVAVLAAKAGTLVFECEEKRLRREVEVGEGLHIFSWCFSNLAFKGFKPLSTTPLPPLEGIPDFTIANAAEGPMTWLRVETAMGPFRPMARSYVFNVERDAPTLLACFCPGPVPLSILLMPSPTANLENFMPTAKYYYVYLTSVPECGPLLDRAGYRIIDV